MRQRPQVHGARWLSREHAELIARLPSPATDADRTEADVDVLIVGSGYGGAMAAAELSGLSEADAHAPNGRRPISVWLLERGVEYLPGSFPSRMEDLTRRLRGSVGDRVFGGEGLFELRLGPDLNVVQANGLGGGSLINAGVMVKPRPGVFAGDWPKPLRKWSTRERFYRAAANRLGASTSSGPNHIGLHPLYAAGCTRPDKQTVLRTIAAAARGNVDDGPITVAMRDKTTTGQVRLRQCRLCGDCATGCNWGAKESLDTNLLVTAVRRGAQVYCGATVLRVGRRRAGTENRWAVEVVHTDPKLRLREGGSRWIVARKLVLAAGALGSTEILLRSQRQARDGTPPPQFSSLLGRRFSGNGDMLSFGYDYLRAANAFADEDQAPGARKVGPTITGVWRTSVPAASMHSCERPGAGPKRYKVTIEEMAVPGPLRRFAQEMLTTSEALHRLGQIDGSTHRLGYPAPEPYGVHPEKIRHTSVFAAMGDDGAAGTIVLGVGQDSDTSDGQVRVVWPGIGRLPLFEAQWRYIESLAARAGMAGRTIPNPMWRLLPPGMEMLARDQRGALLTVHPLGGCPMGDDRTRGVVSHLGEVFDAADAREGPIHEGLFVLDGAIVPTALGTNPALTIAMLALRASRAWRRRWGWRRVPAAACRPVERPVYVNASQPGAVATLHEVHVEAARRRNPDPTVAVFTERLTGTALLAGLPALCRVEVTLTYRPLPLRQIFAPDATGRLSGATLDVDELVEEYGRELPAGRLRIYDEQKWQEIRVANLADEARERALDAAALVARPLSGTLRILQRDASTAPGRVARALLAWLRNRGYRDLVSSRVNRTVLEHIATAPVRVLIDLLHRIRDGEVPRPFAALAAVSGSLRAWRPVCALRRLLRGGVSLVANLSHAGEVRLFEYALHIGEGDWRQPPATAVAPVLARLTGGTLRGRKRITYGRASNPWRQLQELGLDQLGDWAWSSGHPLLKLDAQYLATRETPLFRIKSAANQVAAWVDVAALGMTMLRMLFSIHGFALRKPDRPRLRQVNRLPGSVPGMPVPQIHEIEVDCLSGQPVKMRLTRYRPVSIATGSVPLLMLHGYSASGTTYAHPALKPGLARVMVDRGVDVWIADLRSSAGMPTATHPWTFEQMALADIPAAVEFVCAHTGAGQIDVFAHCMGAAMFSMSVLSADLPIDKIRSPRDLHWPDRFQAARRHMPQRIRRVALSQIGPVLVMTPQNAFRAFVASFLAHALGPIQYAFRPEPHDSLAMELFDRLVATLPYDDAELRRENHCTPLISDDYIGARHRMDALYGHTFKLENMSAAVLDQLDDFFGPLSLDTVAQVAHFARERTITNRIGRNVFVTASALFRNWCFPTLSLHGAQNGLADVSTLHRVGDVLTRAGVPWAGVVLLEMGHQDCLIGTRRAEPSRGEALVGPPPRIRQAHDLFEVTARFFS